MFTETFFQSEIFGEFQKTVPYRGKSWQLSVKEKGAESLASRCLVIKQKLPLGFCWLWIPYGPDGEFAPQLSAQIEEIAKHERAVFVRIEPPMNFCLPVKDSPDFSALPHRILAQRRYTPEHSLVVNLDAEEADILAQMKPKGRYNIGVAKKNGVVILRYDSLKDVPTKEFDDFYEILRRTGARGEFGIHPKEFYQNLLSAFSSDAAAQEDAGISLFLAYEGTQNDERKVIAGIIVIYYKDTATYYYGASSYESRNLMAPYLLQWEAMLESRRRGMRTYDFLGIAPDDNPAHPWAGVTEFKKKFGGKMTMYPPAFLIVYKPFVYTLITSVLRKKF